jgi:CheY-like chemotaxis protein
LRFIKDHAPRLVVLDVNIPDVDGWEVCRRIKADPVTASVLVPAQLSASYVTEATPCVRSTAVPMAAWTEPVEPPVLVATVAREALLRARRAGREPARVALPGGAGRPRGRA